MGKRLGGFGDAAGADASGTNAQVLVCAIDNSFHTPQIWVPATPSDIMGVADGVAVAGFLTAEFTSERHIYTTPHSKMLNIATSNPIRESSALKAAVSGGIV